MDWDEISQNRILLENYSLLEETGILAYVDEQRKEIAEDRALLEEAYQLFQMHTTEDIFSFVLWRFSDKFIPASIHVILNEGIMVDRIKTLAFRNMQSVDEEIAIGTLKPFEEFFRKYRETTSYFIVENEIDPEFLKPLQVCHPEIVVPVLGISGLYGIIIFGPKILGEEYDLKEISYINRLMRFISISVQNTIHYDNSVKEPKTGLYNHNFFNNRLKEEIARSKRSHSVFSILIMDIDKFKTFNDTYGHLAGDEVILNIAAVLKRTLREEDILSRFGGEEFTALLPDTEPEPSWYAAERCRQAVEAMETVYEEHNLKVTVSIGIASIHPYNLGSSEEIMNRADAALYLSKERGRNRSTHYRSGLLNQVLEAERGD